MSATRHPATARRKAYNINMGFLIRPAAVSDLETLEAFASEVYFINLPREPDLLRENLAISNMSFAGGLPKDEGMYIFSLEDTAENKVVGTSCLIERHGTAEAPHTFFRVTRKEVYSTTLKGGFTHEVLELDFEDDGPSEIGGLFVAPAYRRHPDHLGKLISLARFIFIHIHRERFRDQVLAEMMAPITKKGVTGLWEEIGRKFTNMDYATADRFSRKNKEFILSLFPDGPIYLCMLSPDTRSDIGSVHKNTEPAKRMLESIGFTYRNRIDPFDGGPHLRAETDKILPVKDTKRFARWETGTPDRKRMLIAVGEGKRFRATPGMAEARGDTLIFEESSANLIAPQKDEPVHALPL